MVNVNLVRLSYVVACGYVLADANDKKNKVEEVLVDVLASKFTFLLKFDAYFRKSGPLTMNLAVRRSMPS